MKKIILILSLCGLVIATTTNDRYVNPNAAAAGNGTTNALSGANCAYQNLSTWEAARQSNLVTNDYIERVYCSGSGGSAFDTVYLEILGWDSTGPNNYIEIIGSDSAYHLRVSNRNCMFLAEGYIRIHDINIETVNPLASGKQCISLPSNTYITNSYFEISGCHLKGHNSSSYSQQLIFTAGSNTNLRAWNNVMYNTYALTGNEGIRCNSNTIDAYNNTIIGGELGISTMAGTTIAKNNIANSQSYAAFYGTFAAGTDYNTTNRALMGYTVTGSGNTHDRKSQVFTWVDSANSNFALAATDTGARDRGVSDPGSGLFSDDITGYTRPYNSVWDMGAYEYNPGGCTKGTLTRHATIIDTIFNSGIFGHATSGMDSFSISGYPDSSALADKTKDTVAFRWKDAFAKAACTITGYSCSGDSTVVAYDTITVLTWSGSYTPVVLKRNTAMSMQNISSVSYVDTFHFVSLPMGLTGNPVTGAITGTPTIRSNKTGYQVDAMRKGQIMASTYDSITVTWDTLRADSVRPDSLKIADIGTVHGYFKGASSVTCTLNNIAATTLDLTDTTFKFIVPAGLDTGYVDIIMSDTVSSDTLLNAFRIYEENIIPRCTLTIVSAHGTVTRTPDSSVVDSGQAIGLKVAPAMGYTFTGWTGDTVTASDTLYYVLHESKAVTANYTTTGSTTRRNYARNPYRLQPYRD